MMNGEKTIALSRSDHTGKNTAPLCRLELERERKIVEKEMNKLDKKRSHRRMKLQQEKIKSLEAACGTTKSTIPTVIYSTSLESGSSEIDYCEPKKCENCCRKDRIIHRQLREIEMLRQQLREMSTRVNDPANHDLPFGEVICDDDAASDISPVTAQRRRSSCM
uniref:Uncharacterized protein n=1 Tax=Thalassionema nitzschioides TaxID=33649 RepID=A0A6T5XV77_9STRA|mmetsp:Transcript_12245/g.17963  ORF Transcript_12245/g.17963 Transcript_12245/m.17963 type:complete len:164 (-) Transcript_12245:558-1049(-)|eukprot:CAMPEP_0194199592 /NCGR_PEP_ID=MMETSP0156-20130528/562_1 /TAXON_ID=33649 /ORGANISM="Thalassionema nitzschioides, Strain L26-B" /LENGTH=163 /DNA_ID=CAMNT_0038924515 /DNA_START=81 /DNA_END=572 /DNA_ORIENTATION=+